MDIVLTEDGYKAFLVEFRQADKDNAGNKGEYSVDYADEDGGTATYFYKAPNFQLIAYSLNGGARVNLTTYNHVSGIPSCSRYIFRRSLLEGAGGHTMVEKNIVIAWNWTSIEQRTQNKTIKML